MSGSTIGPARAALFTLLTAAAADVTNTALHGVQVTYGPPDQYEWQEVVALLGITDPNEGSVALSPQTIRDENYRIELALKSYDPAASDGIAVDARGWAMADGVRTLIKANLRLNNTVQWALPVSQRSDGPLPPEDANGKRVPGWVIQIRMSIECKGRG